MGLDRSEVAKLLGLAASLDQRTVGVADVFAWQAALEGVTFGECEAAIIAHAKAAREPVRPADILVAVRDHRRRRAERTAIPHRPTDRATAAAAAKHGMADVYAEMGWTYNAQRAAAMTVPCPLVGCWAPVGRPCRKYGNRYQDMHHERHTKAATKGVRR
ncbi:zinc finger domain-containing protein [Actinocrispum wychmicini]|uniref:DNA-binding phage zinc finger domain-containing protein n=1 Tax=Actinocrispum wychmicini TaxID=1213861 RepID=A0A4R2IQ24_9PSEU|nr:hypothetical protein [Actinocrispum wychmicini]TCO47323.1 hypothetical protein EV192_11763 [Actinocrispum wychmicini]